MSQGKRIGYIRVSTTDQNPDRQLENVPLDKKFIDYSSAKSTNREQLKALLEFVREGDTVLVHSMDRLARNVKDLKSIVEALVAKNVQVQFMKENLTFSGGNSATANLILHVMGAFAEFEHAFILERQREGIAIAKKMGRYTGGAKKKLGKDQIEILKKEIAAGEKCKEEIAWDLGVCRQTVYRYMNRIKIEEKTKR